MDTKEEQNPFFSIHLPLTLIALAFSLFFYLNYGGAKQTAENLEWQNKYNKEVIEARKKQRENNEKSLEQNKQNVAIAEQTQKQFGEIMKDLLEIADSGDKDAQLIVKTYGIASTDSGPAATEKKDKKDDKKEEKKEDKKEDKKEEKKNP